MKINNKWITNDDNLMIQFHIRVISDMTICERVYYFENKRSS